MTGSATPRPDVRAALIEAGITLLNEDGPDGLTLRKAAARAGVSHAAPAHHFDGLRGLRTAIAARAYGQFSTAMESRRETAAKDPGAQLLAICLGYLDFARDWGGLFHLMFTCPDLNRDDPELASQGARAFEVLRKGCLPFSHGTPDPAFEATVWALVHGYATLGAMAPGKWFAGGAPPPFEVALSQLIGPLDQGTQ